MAMQLEKTGGLTLTRGGAEDPTAEKPKSYQELGLCLILIALVAWALYGDLSTVDWPAISHSIRALLAAIW